MKIVCIGTLCVCVSFNWVGDDLLGAVLGGSIRWKDVFVSCGSLAVWVGVFWMILLVAVLAGQVRLGRFLV